MENTVKYYLNVVDSNTGNYRIHLDFATGANNTSYYLNDYTTNVFGSVTTLPGSGTFSSNNFLTFNNVTGLDAPYSTHIFSLSKNNKEDGVIFSNFGNSNLIFSGYIIGINAANKLYFESRDSNGPVTRTFSPILANKNILAVSKLLDNINFSLLDQNTKQIITENYDVGNYVLPSDSWQLGSCTGNNQNFNHPNLSGYLDEYVYFDEAVSPEAIGAVMSGFYQRYNPISFSFLLTGYNNYTSGYIQTGNPSGISYNESGFFNYSGQLAYNTGAAFSFFDYGLLTGFSTITDNCNNTLSVYTYLNLTGVVNSELFIPLTGNLFLTSSISGSTTQFVPSGQFINGVTGYLSGLYPIFTGVTGSQVTISGFLTDECGNIKSSYSSMELSGVISGLNIIPLTGLYFSGLQETNYYFTDSLFNINYVLSPSYFTDDNYIMSFGMNGLNYLRNIDSGDFHQIYLPTQEHNLLNINKLAIFDNSKSGFVLPEIITLSGLNGYSNGVGQLGSGVSIGGNLYNPTYDTSGHYFISGNLLIRGNYDQKDIFLFDIRTGARGYTTIFSTGLQAISAINNDIFLNGQKLRSGTDYSLVGSQISLSSEILDIGGDLFSFPRLPGAYISGLNSNTSLLYSSPYSRKTSQLFLNGQRQLINNDYIEISNVDLLIGSGNFLQDYVNIYNNEGNFWS